MITAYEAGRKVNLLMILKHEVMLNLLLMQKQMAVCIQGQRQYCFKSPHMHWRVHTALTALISATAQHLLLTDKQTLAFDIWMLQHAATFGDSADTFIRSPIQAGSAFKHIDIAFDRYHETSIKSGTRKRQSKGSKLIRVIEIRDIPLPAKWKTLSHPDNKADLARFLS